MEGGCGGYPDGGSARRRPGVAPPRVQDLDLRSSSPSGRATSSPTGSTSGGRGPPARASGSSSTHSGTPHLPQRRLHPIQGSIHNGRSLFEAPRAKWVVSVSCCKLFRFMCLWPFQVHRSSVVSLCSILTTAYKWDTFLNIFGIRICYVCSSRTSDHFLNI
ncbi:unnamed protein product [Urochloa humidicola]